jgi:hypothetical protein
MEQVNINVTKVEQDVTINATPNVTQIIVTTQNGGGTQNLNDVLSEGNETDGENIFISDGDEITFDNGSRIRKGLTDAGNGGAKGVALVCSLDYELKWEAGRQYVMQQDGFTIREVSHNFTITPSATDDSTKGFAIDSRWILDNGDVYICTDATEDSAVWELQVTDVQDLQNVTDIGNTTTNDIYIPKLYLYDKANDNYGSLHYTDGNFHIEDGDGHPLFVVEDGFLQLHLTDTIQSNLFTSILTETRNHYLPDADGIIALRSDIPTGELANLDEVGTNEIENHAVTNNKLANMNANTVKGRLSGNGTPQDIEMANLPISTATQNALNLKQNTLTETNFGTFSNSLTDKNTLIDADQVVSVDSADSNKSKKTSWLNVWNNFIKSKTDALYATIASLALKLDIDSPSYTGLMTGVGTTQTGSSANGIINLSQTWNTTGTPTAIRLNVTDTASNAISNLMDLRVGGNSVFSIIKSGVLNIGRNGATIYPTTTIGTLSAVGRNITFQSSETSGNNYMFHFRNINNSVQTSGVAGGINTSLNFTPTSGTGEFNLVNLPITINQTGGANGITRGLFINPTLTSAADFRAIEVTGGKIVFSSTITPSGTTGAQTINRISGKVNAATGTTSLVVTNSLVTTSSIVMCQLGTNDATCVIRSVVEANGSFTINYTAPTTETVIKFTVIN